MKNWVILLTTLFVTAPVFADRLECNGFNTKLIMNLEQSLSGKKSISIGIWGREYERATYPDFFDGGASGQSVYGFLKRTNFKPRVDWSFRETFTLTLPFQAEKVFEEVEGTLTGVVKNGRQYKDTVRCSLRY